MSARITTAIALMLLGVGVAGIAGSGVSAWQRFCLLSAGGLIWIGVVLLMQRGRS